MPNDLIIYEGPYDEELILLWFLDIIDTALRKHGSIIFGKSLNKIKIRIDTIKKNVLDVEDSYYFCWKDYEDLLTLKRIFSRFAPKGFFFGSQEYQHADKIRYGFYPEKN